MKVVYYVRTYLLQKDTEKLSGGSERETDYDKLLDRIKSNGLNPDDYAFYLDLRKYGSVPHSGFGLGLERLVTFYCRYETYS